MKIHKFSVYSSGEDWLELFYTVNNPTTRADLIQRMHNQYELDLDKERKEARNGCEISEAIYTECMHDRLESHDEFDAIASRFIHEGVFDSKLSRYHLITIEEIELIECGSPLMLDSPK